MGLTLEQVGTAVGIDWQNIQKLETGRKKLTHSYMILLAPAFGVEPFELIEDKDKILRAHDKRLQENLEIVRAYFELKEEDKHIVDRFLLQPKNNIEARKQMPPKGKPERIV